MQRRPGWAASSIGASVYVIPALASLTPLSIGLTAAYAITWLAKKLDGLLQNLLPRGPDPLAIEFF